MIQSIEFGTVVIECGTVVKIAIITLSLLRVIPT